MPVPKHERGIVAEEAKLKTGKIELAHRRALWIIFLVACEHAIPSARNSAAPGKCQIRRMPVALQKCVDVALVPIVLLRFENFCNGGAIALAFIRSSAEFWALHNGSNQRQQKRGNRDSINPHYVPPM